jgi:hypothetical protein
MNFAVLRSQLGGGRTATIGHGGLFDDVFLFDHLPGGQWAAVVAILVGWVIAHRVLKHRRRREQLRRRRQIRARLHATSPPVEIDLTEPALEIDLRDRVVYGSEITLESGETLESGIVGPD